jgi:hypothetical protein
MLSTAAFLIGLCAGIALAVWRAARAKPVFHESTWWDL